MAVLWRGDREARKSATPENNRFYRISEELTAIGIQAEPAVYSDEIVDVVREQLLNVDGVKITARMPGGIYPDGMAYAPDAHKLYVSDETGATETVIDVPSNTRIATIPLGGGVGNTQYDSVSRHIFVNVQSRQQLVEIDPATDRIIARIDLPGAHGNHGLLIEPQQRLAFIACQGNDKLLVLDMRTMRVASFFDIVVAARLRPSWRGLAVEHFGEWRNRSLYPGGRQATW